ncbi:MAG: hypothetical protein HOE69_05830 [Euryarchaeota archaeon]|nr:hypothetical protein [Euryarchaeota archaeon]
MTGARARAKLLVLTLFLATLIAFVPTTSATVSGNLMILDGIEPREGSTYDRGTSFIIPSVKIKNELFTTHSSRQITWQICPGNHTSLIACPGNPHDGFTSSGNVFGFQETTVTFSNGYFQPLEAGIHTIFFMFTENDADSSDDSIVYTFNVAAPLRDITLNNLNFDETQVYNSNTSYPFSADFYRRSWESNVNATFGWEMSFNGSVVSSAMDTFAPPVATDQNWVATLPDIVAPFPGQFQVTAGLFNSSGDMNDWNNLGNLTLDFNDSTDVWIETIEPARGYGHTIEVGGQNNTLYALGADSIKVTAGNIGYVPVNASFSLSIFDLNGTLLDGPLPCDVLMEPQETASCVFAMPVAGELLLRAEFPQSFEALDVNPSDNWFEVVVSSRHMPMYPTIVNPTEGERFDSGDTIMFIGQINQYSAMPLNFTWRLNYEEVIGYGQILNTTLPMGEWLVTLTTRDSQGLIETGIRTVRVQNRISLASDPWVTSGEAVMDESVIYNFNEPYYPPEGFQYPDLRDAGISPLRIIDFDIHSSMPGVTDPGMVYADAVISLTGMISNDLLRESIQVYRMESSSLTILESIQYPAVIEVDSETDTLHIYDPDYTNGMYMIAGNLEPSNVSADNLTSVQLPRGALRLEWDPTGDLDDPYFGGWRVYRRLSFPFFWPYNNQSQFNSVLGTEVADLGPYADNWEDPTSLPDGTCVSYLVMAYDRQGTTDFTHGAAAGFDGQTVNWQCGDATPPSIKLSSVWSEVTFDNSSGENIHHVKINWVWPSYEGEENVTWSLYRVELIPSDLTWMEPIDTGLWGEPGSTGIYQEKEDRFKDGIEKEHVYHYILVPMDSVGNVDYTPIQENIETVRIGNQFWDHNSDLIPLPPPEQPPPYGIEWLGEALDYWEVDAFKTTAMIAFGIMLLNVVMIPVVINQTRGVRRRIKRDKMRLKRQRELMLADDIAEDLEDIFN